MPMKHRPRPAEPPAQPDLTGKQRLIDAAQRLHRDKRSFGSLGIREIAREAHLNPNTFYRHFESIDDLALAAIEQVGDRLRPMLHQIRTLVARVDLASVAAIEVSAVFAFALANADAFVIGVIEYHAGTPRVRAAIEDLLQHIASEMADDIESFKVFPAITRTDLDVACRHIVGRLFALTQEYIEHPERREGIVAASERLIIWVFTGAGVMALSGVKGAESASGAVTPLRAAREG